jgi:hypothetical protein
VGLIISLFHQLIKYYELFAIILSFHLIIKVSLHPWECGLKVGHNSMSIFLALVTIVDLWAKNMG